MTSADCFFFLIKSKFWQYWYNLVAKIRRDDPMNSKCSLNEKESKSVEFSLKSVAGKPSELSATENLTNFPH